MTLFQAILIGFVAFGGLLITESGCGLSVKPADCLGADRGVYSR